MKKGLFTGIVIGIFMLGTAGIASATLVYDANVTPGVIFGGGNSNGYFVVDTENNIEVGLRAKIPYAGTYNSNGAGVYSMPTGVHPKWGAPGAAWNYEFSVNVNQDGTGNATLDDFTILLNIDIDPTLNQSFFSFNPFTTFTDNALGDNSTANGAGDDSSSANTNYGNYSVGQNSMNIGWLGQSVNTNIPATFDFNLEVLSATTGQTLASTYMTVEVGGGAAPVPEPATILLFGAGIAGLVGRRLRRQS